MFFGCQHLWSTVFENHSICLIWIFQFWYFLPFFVLSKLIIFGLFSDLLFARIVKWNFFCDFQTLCDTKSRGNGKLKFFFFVSGHCCGMNKNASIKWRTSAFSLILRLVMKKMMIILLWHFTPFFLSYITFYLC